LQKATTAHPQTVLWLNIPPFIFGEITRPMTFKLPDNKVLAFILLLIPLGLIYVPFAKFPWHLSIIGVLVLLLTWLQDRSLKALNFKTVTGKTILTAIVLWIILELSMDFVVQPIVTKLVDEPADYSVFAGLEGKTKTYWKMLAYMWLSAAIAEELLFRGFVFAQLKRIIGDRKWIIILISAVLFSVPHLYQGTAGLITTFLFGLAFGIIYARFQNLYLNILVHGLVDSFFLTMAYLGYLSFFG
jgi:membrane protease YdiL (CAAX protease family)